MKTTAAARDLLTFSAPKPHFLDRVAADAVRRRLAGLAHGVLTLHDGAGVETYGKRTDRCPLNATLHVHDPRFYSEIAFGGTIGAGEAYIRGIGAWMI